MITWDVLQGYVDNGKAFLVEVDTYGHWYTEFFNGDLDDLAGHIERMTQAFKDMGVEYHSLHVDDDEEQWSKEPKGVFHWINEGGFSNEAFFFADSQKAVQFRLMV